MSAEAFICVTCGTQFAPSSVPPSRCRICLDERQHVGHDGQSWRRGRGALLSGDIVQVIDDRDWVSFMWSYPNLIPLPAREVARFREVIGG